MNARIAAPHLPGVSVPPGTNCCLLLPRTDAA